MPSTPSTASPERDPALDGLRGLAVAMVVLFHSAALGGAPGWFRGGFLGVSLFFVLSGMLMAQVVLRDAERSEGRVAAGPYLA
ncbi:MAG: acyltransferase family protein, partial [Ilumatobacteraceae bacterium]